MKMGKAYVIEFALLMPYRHKGGFWERDGGLLATEARRQGIAASLVLLPGDTEEEDKPLITGTLREMADPHWWRVRSPDMVVLYAWGMPRYAPVAKAIRDAGIRLQVQIDSDGVVSPRVHPWRYLYKIYWTYRDEGFRGRFHLLSPVTAIFNLILHWGFPAAYDRPMLTHLEQADWIALECPIAVGRMKGFLRRMGRNDLSERVIACPHPVDNSFLWCGATKSRKIVAIGRWNSLLKDSVLLMSTLRLTLARHPAWTATIIGDGREMVLREIGRWETDLSDRLNICGKIPHESISEELQHASIYLATSRYESFNIAAAEALCCGVSVVGPACLPSFQWFVSKNSGSVSLNRNSIELAHMLSSEIWAWETAQREPQAIAADWRQAVSAEACVKSLLTRLAWAQESIGILEQANE